MTNAEIIAKAISDLGQGWHSSRAVMWQVRRDGWQMTTAKARNVARILARDGIVSQAKTGNRYQFSAKVSA